MAKHSLHGTAGVIPGQEKFTFLYVAGSAHRYHGRHRLQFDG